MDRFGSGWQEWEQQIGNLQEGTDRMCQYVA
jgi:hypothetical protein